MPRLIDGTEVASDSEAWRHELEARRIAGQDFKLRRETFEAIGIKRGQAEVERLRQTIARIDEAQSEQTARAKVQSAWGPTLERWREAAAEPTTYVRAGDKG